MNTTGTVQQAAPSPGESEIDFITISEACEIIGGKGRPIKPCTFYRGVKAGRYPRPVHPVPGISRIVKGKLVSALKEIIAGPEAA